MVNKNLSADNQSKEQWIKSFVFRTMTLNDFVGSEVQQKIEISIPIFFREKI